MRVACCALVAVCISAPVLRAQDGLTKRSGATPADTGQKSTPEMAGAELTPGVQMTVDGALQEPRRIAAAVVAAGATAPKLIVQVGAHHGEFLAVFLDKFPHARGQWTEPNNSEPNLPAAKTLLGRFGDRVDYRYGCGERNITDECIPQGTDVIVTDWVSILQNLDGMYRVYRNAAERLPAGGWLVNIDQVGFGETSWDDELQRARSGLRPGREAPPIHHRDFRVPTVEEQLGAMRAAGFDAQVVWQSFNTVLFMGRKK